MSIRHLAPTALGIAVGCATPPPEPVPTRIEPDGDYAHELTGLLFPTEVGRYRRTHVTAYDPPGHNVSGHYALDGRPHGIATVYHYPASADGSFPTHVDFASAFAEAKRDIEVLREDEALIEESEDDALINGLSLMGFQAVYQLDRPGHPDGALVSTVHLYEIENWLLKFRFTHAVRDSGQVSPLEAEFVRSIRWPIPGDSPPRTPVEPCVRLANSYEHIARNKDLGLSEPEQLEMLGEPDDQDRFVHVLMRNAISVAHAFPDHTSLQIRDLVLRDCTLDDDGRPGLNEFWPWID